MKKQRQHIAHNAVRNSYEAKVINKSLERVGNNPPLKGIIHEVLIKDGINANPANVVKGVKATLAKSPNTRTVDIVVQQGGKIVNRIQAKDHIASVGKKVNQLKSGQCSSARIGASKDTCQIIREMLHKEAITMPKPRITSGLRFPILNEEPPVQKRESSNSMLNLGIDILGWLLSLLVSIMVVIKGTAVSAYHIAKYGLSDTSLLVIQLVLVVVVANTIKVIWDSLSE